MEKKRAVQRGKPFYSMLVFFIVFVLLIAGLCLGLCLMTLDALGEQARTGMRVALEANMRYMSAAREVLDFSALAEYLDGDGLLSRLALQSRLDGADRSLLTQRIEGIEEAENWNSKSHLYVYFRRSDYAAGGEPAAQDARENMGSWAFSEIAELPLGTADFSVTRFIFDGAGNPNSLRVQLYKADVYLVYVTFGQPPVSIPEDILAAAYGSEMYFYDSYGTAVAVAGCTQELIGLYDYNSLGSEENGSFSFEHQGKSYDCYYEKVADSDTKFAMFTMNRAQEAKEMLLTTVISIVLVTIALGSAGAFFAARRLYAPVEGLLSRLPLQAGDGEPGMRDDFRLIGDALNRQDKAIAKQRKLLRQTYLLRRLKGQNTDFYAAYAEEAEAFFFDAPGHPFAVAAMGLDACTAEAESFAVDSGALLAKVLEYCAQNGYAALGVWDGDLLLLTFDLRNKDLFGLGVLLENLRSYAEEREGYLLSFYVSALHREGREIHRAYGEVMQSLEYCTLLEKYNTVQGYESIRAQLHPCGRRAVPDRAAINRLCEAVESLSCEEAMAAFDSAAASITARGDTALIQVKAGVSLLRDSIAQAIFEIDPLSLPEGEDTAAFAGRVMQAAALPQLRRELAAILAAFTERSERQDVEGLRFEQMRDYVRESFADPSFSAGAVAERFGTCQSNVTRLFKKYNNTGFLEYLHTLRVERAKALLRDTNMSVAEIAVQVGYTNPLTLTRAFKRYAGTTPGAFRKS